MARLVTCPSCHEHVRADDSRCPHCAVELRSIAAPFTSAVLMGLALTGCPSDDDTTVGDGTGSATLTTTASTEATTSSTSLDTSSTTIDVTSIGEDSAYGTPDTGITQTDTSSEGTSGSESDSSSDSTGTDTGASSDSTGTGTGGGEPLYGVLDSG